jgi:repressor LexA
MYYINLMSRTPKGQTREKILRFMRERILSGAPPTVREVRDAFSFGTTQSARYHLEILVDEGRLEVDRGHARGYRLPGRGHRPPAMIPILGRVPAGSLDLAVEDLEDYVPVQDVSSSEELFGLRVNGKSMINAGILPGDLVIVRRQADANPGDIVVALVEDDATVKRLKKVRGRIELHPENPDFDPIRPDDVLILGKVIEVRRTL